MLTETKVPFQCEQLHVLMSEGHVCMHGVLFLPKCNSMPFMQVWSSGIYRDMPMWIGDSVEGPSSLHDQGAQCHHAIVFSSASGCLRVHRCCMQALGVSFKTHGCRLTRTGASTHPVHTTHIQVHVHCKHFSSRCKILMYHEMYHDIYRRL